jgi:hypothetical protein
VGHRRHGRYRTTAAFGIGSNAVCRLLSGNDSVIDWTTLAADGLWIVGLAILVASLSYSTWLARTLGTPVRDVLRAETFQIVSAAGLALTSLGWGLSYSTQWWETGAFGLLAAWCGYVLIRRAAASAAQRSPRSHRVAED